MTKKNVLIDIDGTITEDVPNEEYWRMPYVEPFPNASDRINQWYDKGHNITFFTSRTEKLRLITEIWLKKHGFKYHKLLMNKPRGGNYIWIDNLDGSYVKLESKETWNKDLRQLI